MRPGKMSGVTKAAIMFVAEDHRTTSKLLFPFGKRDEYNKHPMDTSDQRAAFGPGVGGRTQTGNQKKMLKLTRSGLG